MIIIGWSCGRLGHMLGVVVLCIMFVQLDIIKSDEAQEQDGQQVEGSQDGMTCTFNFALSSRTID